MRTRVAPIALAAPRGRALVRAAWTLAVALIAVLCLKMFVCDVKRVESASMEPTIFGSPTGGESVLVLYGSFEPERFDCVVISREAEEVPIVKRVVGLPQESVRISHGDLLIDGRRLPPSAPRPPPILVFDGARQSVSEAFEPARGRADLWTEEAGEWILRAERVATGSADGLMSLHRPLRDGYVAPGGSVVRGENEVNDAVFECEIAFPASRVGGPSASGRVLVELVEQGDVFRYSLEFLGQGSARARISRSSAGAGAGAGEEVLETADVVLAGEWMRLSCSNVDNALAFEVGDAAAPLCHEYAENRFAEGDRLKEGRTFGERLRFGGEGGTFAFRAIRILRDLHYVPRGIYGVTAPCDLGPHEYFVLGDNSASSRDSREWGPIHASRILGRPLWVVWPPARIGRLPATVPGPCDSPSGP